MVNYPNSQLLDDHSASTSSAASTSTSTTTVTSLQPTTATLLPTTTTATTQEFLGDSHYAHELDLYTTLIAQTKDKGKGKRKEEDADEPMNLHTLPYDILFNISTYLETCDIHALQLTCKALQFFSTSRPVYRKLARDLIWRCRALPLKGFQRVADLTTEQLVRAVNRAYRYEVSWRHRAPRPVRFGNTLPGGNNYLDGNHVYPGFRPDEEVDSDMGMEKGEGGKEMRKLNRYWARAASNYRTWYKVVSAPPGEEVDWLSPITSSYTLCATRSGRVVCWDVQTDSPLAEWCPEPPGEDDSLNKWELWKCRVEFEERAVYFTIAKLIVPKYDDSRVMSFVLMKLTFFDGPTGEPSPNPPVFSRVTDFMTSGIVMNVFLLDPATRLLSAFVWISGLNNIGLYVLPDWEKDEYVFVDTGIECKMTSNWSCILYDKNIVIHCEEADAVYQHFYPISLLEKYTQHLDTREAKPRISQYLRPWRSISKKFVFPAIRIPEAAQQITVNGGGIPITNGPTHAFLLPQHLPQPQPLPPPSAAQYTTTIIAPAIPNPSPFPFPPWYPETAHFVRQWWPSIPGINKVSCTVILLASHDQATHRTNYVLAQHYFRVPLDMREWNEGEGDEEGEPPDSSAADADNGAGANGNGNGVREREEPDDSLMHMWYVSTPFEVVRVFLDSEELDEENQDRPRPLVAVDFGHAVWIEYVNNTAEEQEDGTVEVEVEVEANGAGSSSGSMDAVDGDGDAASPDSDDEDYINGIPTRMLQSTDSEPKALRFVTFPWFSDREANDGSGGAALADSSLDGVVRTLEVPDELDLGAVETINLDQSQGAVILSDHNGKIFILCYE